MKTVILSMVMLLVCVQSTRVLVYNNFTRSIVNPTAYLKNGGFDYLPERILPGEEEMFHMDDDDLMFVDLLQGMLILPVYATTDIVAIAWEVPKDDQVAGYDNKIGLYYGAPKATSEALYTAIFDSTTNVPTEMKARMAEAGWFKIEITDGPKISAFMSSNERGDIIVHLEEGNRGPVKDKSYFIQPLNTAYFVKYWGPQMELEFYNPKHKGSYLWKLTDSNDPSMPGFYNIRPFYEDFKPLAATQATNTTYGWIQPLQTGYSVTDWQWQWEIKRVEKDIYTIENRKTGYFMDLTECANKDNLAKVTCTSGAFVMVAAATQNIEKAKFRLIPSE